MHRPEPPRGAPGDGHCEPEDLALRALGEDVLLDEGHLAACPGCQEDLASQRRLVEAARGRRSVERVVPPPSVWAGIAAATGVTAAPRQDRLVASATPPDGPDRPHPAAPVAPSAPAAPATGARRTSRRLVWAVAAAVAGLAVGASAVAVVQARSGPGDTPALPRAVERTPLAPLAGAGTAAPGAAASGSAVLEQQPGRWVLRVSTHGLSRARGTSSEVWLMQPATGGLLPLGFLPSGGSGDFTVPAGVDLTAYPVVDVSAEPLDGDPGHSGDSVLRGTLRA